MPQTLLTGVTTVTTPLLNVTALVFRSKPFGGGQLPDTGQLPCGDGQALSAPKSWYPPVLVATWPYSEEFSQNAPFVSPKKRNCCRRPSVGQISASTIPLF